MPEDELTAAVSVSGHSDLIELHFRDAGPLAVPLRVFADLGCKLGMTVSVSLYNRLVEEARIAQAREIILRRLSHRSMTVKQVRFLLQQQGFSEVEGDAVVKSLNQAGLLNDRRYAEDFADSKGRRLSRAELVWKLTQRGVRRDVAQEAVQRQDVGDAREYEAALNFGRKFWRRHERDETHLRAQKLGAYLQRRGFSMEVIRRVLKTLQSSLS